MNFTISSINFTKARPAFIRAFNKPKLESAPCCDSFEKSQDIETRYATIKDSNNQDVEAKITRQIAGANEYEKSLGIVLFNIYANGEDIGYATTQDYKREKKLYLTHIHTNKKYKGTGTELVKSAVLESKRLGYEGELTVNASYKPQPYIFYYKNNFRATSPNENCNAIIKYAIKNNIPIERLLNMRSLEMKLSKEGADELLRR